MRSRALAAGGVEKGTSVVYAGINQMCYVCKCIEDKTVDTSFELVKSQTDKGEKRETYS